MGYYLTLQADGTLESIFPSFYDHVIDRFEYKNDLQVAQTFNRSFKIIHEMAKKYCSEHVQLKIQSYSHDETCNDYNPLHP